MNNAALDGMRNRAMYRKITTGEAVDLSETSREGAYYVLTDEQVAAINQEKDFCVAKTEEWIRSIGRRNSDGVVLASTDAEFYQNAAFECLWLR